MGNNKDNLRASICLVMIVRDEEDTIEKCISSLRKYIDYYVIVDTGSKDNTIAKIKEVTKKMGLDGEVHERKWVNFGHNRTESLELAKGKCDYRLVMDADDTFESFVDNPFEDLDPSKSGFGINLQLGGISYNRCMLIKSDEDWEFVGVLHEYPFPKNKQTPNLGMVNGCVIHACISPLKRAKSQKEKYANDARILAKAVKEDPNNSRYMFYLGQSYFDSQQYAKAIEAYKKRTTMGGWVEEVYISYYKIALCLMELKRKDEVLIDAFSKAWENRPFRLEAAYHLARILRLNKRHVLGFTYANMAMQNFMNYPGNDTLFYEKPIHEWMFLDEYCMAAYYVGQRELAKSNMDQFFKTDIYEALPDNEKERLKKNYGHYCEEK